MQFLEHGLRYAFPVEQGVLSRGIPHGLRCRATEKRKYNKETILPPFGRM